MISTNTHRKSNLKAFGTLVIFLLTSFHAYSQPLTGTYSINPSGGNYTTFTAAVNDLNTKGVSGPVVFKVANGTYTEQVRIGTIPGASAVNTVTIQSLASDSAMVVLTWSSTLSGADYTLKIDSTDYLSIREITIEATNSTYARCIEFNGSATNDSIVNCRIIGYNTSTYYDSYSLIYSYADPTSNITIQNNHFSNGSIGIFFQGVNSTTLSPGTKIVNNIFDNQNDYGMTLYGQDAPVINNNIITTLNDPATGILLQYCDNAMEVKNNKINLPFGNFGIDIYYCDGTNLNPGQVINNFVSIPSGSTASGIYMTNSTFQKIYHNSINITAYTTNDYGAFYLTGGSNIDVRNNIFANFGENYAYNIKTPAALAFSDYNNYYSNGDYLGIWTNAVENLSDLKIANSKDINSISFNPVFVSTTDPHATSFRMDDKGTNLGVATDIDGQIRANNDIGADEFTGSGAAITGTHTIGATASDYASFSLAIDALNKYGISGPVTFNVKDGSYNEQVTIMPIAGADVSNPVRFQSLSGDSTKVELSYNSAVNNNYLVHLEGSDFITFRKMSFSALNTTYSRIFWLSGSTNTDSITSCILSSDISGTSSDAVIYAYQNNTANLVISNNIIGGGRHAVYLNSNSSIYYIKGTKILKNIISDQKGYTNDVIYLRYNEAPEVSYNSISNTASNDFWGIFLQNCNNDFKIIGNKISSTGSNGGIQLYTCPSLNLKRGLVANNFVDIGGTSYAYGIYTYDADFLNIYNNSVRITSSNTTYGRAYYNNSTSGNVTLKNNIFANLGDGYASYTDGSGLPATFTADKNDYYSTGNSLAYWNGTNQPDLTTYKTALVTQDVNSISVNPSFVSASDLHTTSSFLNSVGLPLAEVTTDIDGATRDLVTPDIGADEFSSVISPLAGATYTIGGSPTPDYVSFSAAVNDLNTRGISGPVVFNVRDGVYLEQLSFLDINGENDINTITFQSQSGDSSLVELSFAANLNNKHVVQLVGTDNITFKDMTFSATDPTYALVFYLRGGLQKVNIENCIINGYNGYGGDANIAAIYSGNAIVSNLTIKNCQITGGSTGIFLESPSTSFSTNTLISNNQFSGQYYNGILLRYHNAPRVESNQFTNETSGTIYAVNLQYCNNDFQVLKNKIDISFSDGGIYIYYCPGTTTKKGLIANNLITIGGTSTAYGIFTSNSDYPRVYYNTVKITSTYVNGGIAYYNSNGSFVDVKNNIFSNFGGGYAYYANNTTSVTVSDYNNLFTTGNFLGYWGGNYADLASFKAANGKDLNSVSVNPVFVSPTDLHTTSYYLDNKATNIAAITTDIDGEPRNATTPDIGADEFVASYLPMSGPYTIGGTTPDFATFSLAADALNNKGISGPVTFNVRNGAYTENFELFEISGASVTNTITFQAETGDSTLVTLSNNAASPAENYVIKLTGTDNITIRNFTIVGTNSTYSNIILLNGNVTHLKILNNIISMNNNSSGSGIYSPDGNYTSDIQIKNNKIIEGGDGIYIIGNGTTPSQAMEISGNIFSSQTSYGIYLVNEDGPVIKGNTISTNEYSFYGIYLSNCDNKVVISENKVSSANYCYGIYLYYCIGNVINQGLIANNFVSIKGSDYAYGIYLAYSESQNVYYNSVNIASTASDLYYLANKLSFYITGGANIVVKNNIFANTQGGYSYYVNTPSAVLESDYNDYYSTTDIAYWVSARTNLAALKTANSLDVHSISANPMYVSDNDLRVTQTLLNKAAIPLSQVTKDIFGNARDASLPDIGAMEYYCTVPNFNITASSTCLNDSTLLTDNSTGIAYGSTYSYDFDADFVPDTTFTAGGSILKHLFTTVGVNTANFIVSQLGGCNDLYAVSIDVKPTPVLEVLTSGALCNNNNGSASVTVTQATQPFTYLWSNGSTLATAGNMGLGKYSVSVKSADNCIGSQTFEIENALNVTVIQLNAATCAGSDGKAFASVTGGALPYTYVWSTGETNDTSFTLPTGAQYVNVTDANGCSSLGSINIANDGSGPQITLNSAVSNKCFGEKTGLIDVSVTGGSLPYTIQWSNGSVTEDLSGLPAGIYDILVNDNSGCEASASYNIDQPAVLSVSSQIVPASCSGSDGQAFAFVSGGSEPYKYEWTGGKTSPLNDNLTAGVYSLKVTDNNLCTVIIPVLINNTGGPVVSFKTVKGTSCSNANSGAIDINLAGGAFPYTYQWSPGGETTQDVTSLMVGNYEVRVTDNVGCIGVNSVTIKQDPPLVNPLCMVTVDSVTERNLVIWEKGNTTDVAAYNIYRESSSKEIFQLIATIPVTEVSQYLDSIADPSVRSWKYKLSVVDVCGQESELSPAHKTIHLTQNLGLKNAVNLIWDSYEGFAVSTYNVLRFTQAGRWETLASIPSNLTSYTDLNPPTDQDLFYVIEAARPGGACITTKASSYNSARSNRQSSTVKSTIGIKPLTALNSLSLYPNPASDVLNLRINQDNLKLVRVDLIDIKGQVLQNSMYHSNGNQLNVSIDISRIPKGIYILRIGSDGNVNYRKLVVER